MTDARVVELVSARCRESYVVLLPELAKLDAGLCELVDQIGRARVMWVACCFRAKDSRGVVGDGGPVDEEAARALVEEHVADVVRRAGPTVEHLLVDRAAQGVGCEVVPA